MIDWAQEEGARLVRRWCEGYLTHPVIEDELAALGEIVATALREARRAALEDAIEKVRRDCGGCEGTGYANPNAEDECEYCGRPMEAIRALLTPVTPEEPNG